MDIIKSQSFLALIVLILIIPIILSGQNINHEYMKDISMRNIGPAGMSGRITAIDAVNSNPNHIYIGSASGGVWTSKNRGITWKPIFEHESTMSIGSVKITQSNPDVIWVGTGEGNPRNSHNSGKGIFKSIDGGETWNYMGLENTRVIHRIYIDEQNPDIVYAAAMGSAWGPSKDRGVYKTTDGGKTWNNVLYINETTGAADMIVDPDNHNKLFVAMWDHQRTPYNFRSGGDGSGLYVTYDSGANWKKLGKDEGLPDETIGRIGLAAATNKSDVLYALIETKNKQAIYRSNDAGLHWKMQSDKNVGNRPFYYSEIYVDPSNENRIFNLWSYVSKSEDGGRTFKTIMDYGNNVHPDHHAFWIDKNNPSYMIDGNDGGLNISEDGGDNWRFVENLPVGQFYHLNIDNEFPYQVYGGMQDNGSWVGPSYVLKRGGIRNSDFQEVYFGDGFDIAPLPHDNRKGYAMSQGGNVSLYNRDTGRNRFVKPVQDGDTPLRFSWNAALALDPFENCGVYFGSQFVHYSDDCGQSWSTISPDLTTDDPKKQDQSKSGGLTLDVTGAENHTTILAIAPSTLDQDIIWASSDDGRLHITRDRGDNWSSVEGRLRDAPRNGWIPQITVSNHDKGEAFVVVNNYRQNDWKPYLYHTSDGGKSFRNIADANVMGSFVCSVIQDHINPNLIFAGTDDGLYVSYNKGGKWTKVKEFPSVQIRDMQIQEREDDLVLGTFGRSMWVIDDLSLIREMADKYNNKDLNNEAFALFPVEDAYHTTYTSVDGHRFIAQSMFVGDNISKNARFNYWIHPDSVADKSKKKVKFHILDADNDTIRTFSSKPKKGLNTTTWSLNKDGVRGPSWNDPKPEDDMPGGQRVAPGDYHVVVSYGEQSLSDEFTVLSDPRHEPLVESIDEAPSNYYAGVERAGAAFDKLKKMNKELDFISTYVKNQPDTIASVVSDTIKSLRSDIDSLQLMFMGPKDVVGYVSNKGKLSEVQRPTGSYLRSYWEETTPNGQRQLSLFTERLEGIEEKIKLFQEGKYAEFKKTIMQLPPILFDTDQ